VDQRPERKEWFVTPTSWELLRHSYRTETYANADDDRKRAWLMRSRGRRLCSLTDVWNDEVDEAVVKDVVVSVSELD
jgi:hypothetical protein